MTAFIAPMRRIDKMAFGKPTHYYVDANGNRIPGVTTIIGDGVPKPALIGWSGNVTAEYAVNHWDDLAAMPVAERLKVLKGARYAERDAAAKRGTEIHALAEKLVHGTEVDVPDELAGHVEAYVRFLDEWDPQPVLVEGTVVNYTIGYAGTLDLIADMAGERWLLDVKSTRSGVYGETGLQLAAYRYAEFVAGEDETPMPEVDRCGVVWVRSDGYDVVDVTASEREFLHFRYAARVADWQKNLSQQVVGQALEPKVAR